MKVLLYGRFGQYPFEIEPLINQFGLEIVKENPDVVITFGGDGTLLGSERDYPDIPKLPLKNSAKCFKCFEISNEELLKLLVENKLTVQTFEKLQIETESKNYEVVNDVVIRNYVPNTALRFNIISQSLNVDPKMEFIGDGLVASTVFGSTGYFYSITKNSFKSGFALAFNNIHNSDLVSLPFDQNCQIEIGIIRGPAQLAVDNDPHILNLSDGQKIFIKPSDKLTKILTPKLD